MYFLISVLMIICGLLLIYALYQRGILSEELYKSIRSGIIWLSVSFGVLFVLISAIVFIGFFGGWLISISPWLPIPFMFFGIVGLWVLIDWITY